jgi:integrase
MAKYPGVRKRGKGFSYRYSIDVTVDGIKTRKQPETPAFATAKQAYEAGTAIKAQQFKGTYIEEVGLTFDQWADEWLMIYGEGKKLKSVLHRTTGLKRARAEFGSMRLKDITRAHYQRFIRALKNDKLAIGTIQKYHITVKMCVQKAVDLELIAKNFATGVDLPTNRLTVTEIESNEAPRKYLNKKELQIFLKTAYEFAEERGLRGLDTVLHISRVQNARLFELLALTGLRIGETLALTPPDIDYNNHTIKISKTLTTEKGVENYIIDTPKTISSARTIDVTAHTIDLIKQQIKDKKRLRLASKRWIETKDDFIFASAGREKPGCPLSDSGVRLYMLKILKMADLPPMSPHKLRHTYTSLMAEAGVDLESIQRQLGHKNDNVTRQVYLHITEERRKINLRKFEKFMGN